jgi:hypothetical protein
MGPINLMMDLKMRCIYIIFLLKKKMIHLHPYTSSYNQVSNSLVNLWDPIWPYKFNGEFKNDMCKNCDGDLFISFLFSKRKRKKGIG